MGTWLWELQGYRVMAVGTWLWEPQGNCYRVTAAGTWLWELPGNPWGYRVVISRKFGATSVLGLTG
jgi:hypothetical protein